MERLSERYAEVLDRLNVLRFGLGTEASLRKGIDIEASSRFGLDRGTGQIGLSCLVTLGDALTGKEYVGFVIESDVLYKSLCEARTPKIFTKLFVPW